MRLPFDIFVHDIHFSFANSWLLVGWVFVLGAAIGSFLNVVAYRLPRGMSLNRPGSQCPACRHPIRWYDNVPILGWLMLGGRCRDCRAAISPRYPAVELIAAAASGLVVWSQIEPAAAPADADSFSVNPLLLAYRLLVVYSLLCAVLLEFDRQRAPLRWLLVVLLVGVLLSMASISEVVAAAVLGLLAWPMLIHGRQAIGNGVARVAELALVGTIHSLIGLEAIAVFAQVVLVTTRVADRWWPPTARFGWAAGLFVGTLVWTLIARAVDVHQLQPGGDVRMSFLTAGAIVAVLSVVGRVAGGRQSGTIAGA